jgi:hypothetical protein
LRPPYTPEECAIVLEAIERGGSYRTIANDLLWSKDRVRRCHLYAEKSRAEGELGHGAHKTLPGFGVSKVSTLHNRDGEAVAQWVQQRPDAEQQREAMQAAFDAMAADLPRVAPIDAPKSVNRDLANLYTLTDSHVGMLAWRKEGGADWDLEIAERTLLGCFSAMVSSAPSAGVGIVNVQGDFLHFDGLKPVTPEHGHVLDADSRFSKVVSVAIRIIRRVVDLALTAHPTVHLLICEGNHDESSSVWLRQMFAALYENEPRLTVNDSELPFYVYQHGKVMLAFHHGHKMKNDQLPMLFAAQFPTIWGATTKRYCHTGHRHHEEVKEHSGMVVTQHSTLAARDAYAARGGWVSERQVKAISYHAEYGQVAVNTIVPEMLAA